MADCMLCNIIKILNCIKLYGLMQTLFVCNNNTSGVRLLKTFRPRKLCSNGITLDGRFEVSIKAGQLKLCLRFTGTHNGMTWMIG